MACTRSPRSAVFDLRRVNRSGSVMPAVRRNTMEPHLRVKLLTTPTVLDGRRGAFTTGYRPQFRYRGQDNDVSITIPGDI